MIIKNLSRTNAGGRSQLVNYIFKYIFKAQSKEKKVEDIRYPFFSVPANVHLHSKDITYLRSEWLDAKLLGEFKAKYPDFNIKAFIESCLVAKEQGVENMDLLKMPFVIRHNMRSNTIAQIVREFEENEKGRVHKRADQTSIHHTIISWSNKDTKHITQDMLRDMSRKYVELRGNENMYCGTLHTDRSHFHLHIAMSATTISGKSARISQKAFEEVKVKLQEYQMLRYPELSHSIVQFGKAKDIEQKKEAEKNIKTRRSSEKNLLLGCIETNYAKASSTQHFISLLNEHGYKEYYRNNVLTGIETENGKYKYRFGRLGVDLEHLEQLDTARAKETKDLKEIHQVRGSLEPELRAIHDIDKGVDIEKIDEHDRMQLQELDNVRSGKDTVMEMDDERDFSPEPPDANTVHGASDDDDMDDDSAARSSSSDDDDDPYG